MMAVARCPLPNRPVRVRHTDLPGRAVGLRAIPAICTPEALFYPPGQPDSAPTESVSPVPYDVGGLATLGDPPWPTSLTH